MSAATFKKINSNPNPNILHIGGRGRPEPEPEPEPRTDPAFLWPLLWIANPNPNAKQF